MGKSTINQLFLWVNQLFLWPFSSSQTVTVITRGEANGDLLWSDDPPSQKSPDFFAGKKGLFKCHEKHLHTIHKKVLDWVMISFFHFDPRKKLQFFGKNPHFKPDPWNVAALGARATDVNLSPFQATSDCANMIANWRKNGDFTYSTTNWLVVYLPLWKIWVKWDDEIPNMMGK